MYGFIYFNTLFRPPPRNFTATVGLLPSPLITFLKMWRFRAACLVDPLPSTGILPGPPFHLSPHHHFLLTSALSPSLALFRYISHRQALCSPHNKLAEPHALQGSWAQNHMFCKEVVRRTLCSAHNKLDEPHVLQGSCAT